jgi:3-polyprenyl-4-hydroxybenzoate decarboxylase
MLQEIFNKLPLSCERKKLKLDFQLKNIQLMQLKVKIKEIKQKSLLLEQVRGMNFVSLITNLFLTRRSAQN